MSDKFVECGNHGRAKPAFLCLHLRTNSRVGWNEPDAYDYDEDSDFFGCINAWCDPCERKAIETGGWNDESEAFAEIGLVCEACALRIRALNLQRNIEEIVL